MNRFTRCQSCKKYTIVKISAATRADLQMEKGDEFDVKCQDCGNVFKAHVNDVHAEVDRNVVWLGVGISVVVTFVLLTRLGLIGTISIGIPFLFWTRELKVVKDFNGYKINRKR